MVLGDATSVKDPIRSRLFIHATVARLVSLTIAWIAIKLRWINWVRKLELHILVVFVKLLVLNHQRVNLSGDVINVAGTCAMTAKPKRKTTIQSLLRLQKEDLVVATVGAAAMLWWWEVCACKLWKCPAAVAVAAWWWWAVDQACKQWKLVQVRKFHQKWWWKCKE